MSSNREGYDSISFQRFFSYDIGLDGEVVWDYTYVTFGYLVYVVKNLFYDISYFQFQVLIMLLLGFLCFRYLRCFILSFRGVCFLYLFSGTFAMDGLQFKNFISVLIFIIAFVTLINNENTIRSITFYILLIAISALFHFSFVVYLPFMFSRFISYEKIEKYANKMMIIGIVAFALLFFFSSLLPILLQLIATIPILEKLFNYVDSFNGARSIPPMLLYFLQLFILKQCNNGSRRLPEELLRFEKFVLLLNLMIGFLLPGLLYANAAYRLFRNIYILNFIVMTNWIMTMKRLGQKRIMCSLLVMIMTLGILVYPNFLLKQYEDILKPVLYGCYYWIP